MIFIYILELENNKYYIGKTTNPEFRIESHFNSSGSVWTRLYKPIKLLDLIRGDDYDEDKYTRIYMDRYGINNVRGGSYVQIKLDELTIENLLKMNRTANDNCFLCGDKGHFARNCIVDKIKEEKWNCDNCNEEFINFNKFQQHKSNCREKKKNKCTRCGKDGHNSTECYAKKNVNKNQISDTKAQVTIEVFCCDYCDKEFDTLKGVTCHENLYCKANKAHSSKKTKTEYLETITTTEGCYRCGREGHYSTTCYAKTNVNGKYLS